MDSSKFGTGARLAFCRRAYRGLNFLSSKLAQSALDFRSEQERDCQQNLYALTCAINRARQLAWPASDVVYVRIAGRITPRIFALARKFVSDFRDMSHIHAWRSQLGQVETLQTVEVLRSFHFLELAVLLELNKCITRVGAPAAIASATRQLKNLWTCDYGSIVRQLLSFEPKLEADPAGIYSRCDYATKYEYRLAVATIAKKLRRGEPEVAETALALCDEACRADERARHIGHYLVGEGVPLLLKALHGGKQRLVLGGILRVGRFALSVNILSLVLFFAGSGWLMLTWATWPLAVSILLIAQNAAISIVQEVLKLLFRPRACVSLDFSARIPQEYRTAIAVPTLMISAQQLDKVLARLEENYRIVRDSAITMLLLIDFVDASCELPRLHELDLRNYLIGRVEELNRQYCDGENLPFVVLCRPRRYSAIEKCWMGWERKRGKIEALCRLVLGRPNELYACNGAVAALHGIRYLIVLDDDNALMPGAVQALCGAMAHPLNRPLVDTRGVYQGHAIGMPRIEQRSAIGRLPDLVWRLGDYDLFGMVSFPGKGIYDVAAYMAAIDGRIPEGIVLSHDTVEGFWTRPCLVSQAMVVEDFPSNYIKLTERQQRWVRGNWQNLLLMFDHRLKRLPAIAWLHIWRQNIVSLLPIAMTLAIVVSMVSARHSLEMLCGTIGVSIVPSFLHCSVFHAVLSGAAATLKTIRDIALFNVVQIVMAPHRALVYTDAIIRATWRLLRGQLLLQWRSAASLEQDSKRITLSTAYLLCVPPLALLLAAFLAIERHRYAYAALVTVFWAIAPLYLFRIERKRDITQQLAQAAS